MERYGKKRRTVNTKYIVLGSLGPQISEALASGHVRTSMGQLFT
jgi:hypothetical protein